MSPIALALVSLSAVTHASWNLISKRSSPSASYFLIANLFGAALLLPVLLAFRRAVPYFSPAVWTILALTGLFQAIYYTGLALAYRKGEMTLAYPMVRSLPVVIVPLVNLLIGRGKQVPGLAVAGMVLITMGVLMLPSPSGASKERPFKTLLSGFARPVTLLAFIAAIGTVGYSMVDDAALRLLRVESGMPFSPAQFTLVYAFFEGMSSCLWLALSIRLLGARNPGFSRGGEANLTVRAYTRNALLSGFLIYFTYTLVLISMNFARNVSYIVAFRQLSVPLGAILGIAILKERPTGLRLAGLLCVFAGLLLVGVG
jgi:drug/metabolite transporter (DMT)-like permease